MSDEKMLTTRLSSKQAKAFSELLQIYGVRKSDFIKIAIDKFIKNNRLLLDHQKNEQKYIGEIKAGLLRDLSSLKGLVRFEPSKDFSPALVLSLADWLYRTSSSFWGEVKNISLQYGIRLSEYSTEADFEDFEKFEYDLSFLSIEDLLLTSFKEVTSESMQDIEGIFYNDDWTDYPNANKLLLIVALRQSFKQNQFVDFVKEAIKTIKEQEQEEKILLLDFSGKFKRTANGINLPARTVNKSEVNKK